MLSLPASIRIYVYSGVTDMRRSFDRLAQMVQEHLQQDPESGHLYLFFNRRRDCVKMLLWEGDGFVIWYKKQETECQPKLDWSEFRRSAHNPGFGPADAGRVVSPSRGIDSRRRCMSRDTEVAAPPRAEIQQRQSCWITSGTNSRRSVASGH